MYYCCALILPTLSNYKNESLGFMSCQLRIRSKFKTGWILKLKNTFLELENYWATDLIKKGKLMFYLK